jgi:hypothetical protein
MISVLALDRNDGWVFVSDGETIRLLRPPYRLADARVVQHEAVERAVTQHGYVAMDAEVPTWAELVALAQRAVTQHREAEGRPIPEQGVGRALLRVASPDMVARILERVREELIPKDELAAAEKILDALRMEAPHLHQSPQLSREAAELLSVVLKRREERIRIFSQREGRFPRLAKCGALASAEKQAQRIASRGSMFLRDNAA